MVRDLLSHLGQVSGSMEAGEGVDGADLGKDRRVGGRSGQPRLRASTPVAARCLRTQPITLGSVMNATIRIGPPPPQQGQTGGRSHRFGGSVAPAFDPGRAGRERACRAHPRGSTRALSGARILETRIVSSPPSSAARRTPAAGGHVVSSSGCSTQRLALGMGSPAVARRDVGDGNRARAPAGWRVVPPSL